MAEHLTHDDVTAKGDILVGSADGVVTNLAVGANTKVLKADSSQATGLKWEDLTLFTQTADKTIANTVTETTLISTGNGSITLPANFFVAGRNVRYRIRGIMSTTDAPTVRIRVKLGATTIADTTAVALIASNLSNNYFEAEGGITCRTTGATGTVISSGLFIYDKNDSSSNAIGIVNTGTVTIDTTASLALDVTFEWGTASASNTITSQIATLEVLN